MAFLDNSGDIILDAVLTDTGRYRLAQGNGSFRIAKFALGDDEIDYSLYDKNASGGTAYYDLAILQTPILEAFTNNASSLKSKLLTITRTNLLYLPVIKLNNNNGKRYSPNQNLKVHILATNADTVSSFSGQKFINGSSPNGADTIRLEQGLDTREISTAIAIPEELKETQYIIESDSRLFTIHAIDLTQLDVSFIDDDLMATHYTALQGSTNNKFIANLNITDINGIQPAGQEAPVLAGPYGTALEFTLKATTEIQTNDYLFDTLGGTTANFPSSGVNLKYIDTNIRITGATTGYRIDVPVRIVKKYTP